MIELCAQRNETDLAVAGLTYTPQRKEVIGYTIPIFAKVPVSCIAPRNQGAAMNYWVYVDIFPRHVWAVQAAGLSVLSLGFFLVRLARVNRFHSEDDSESFGPLNSVALVATMIMQLTYEVGVKSASARILFYITSVSAYLLFAYYTCDLTARMTSGPAPVPIRSFRDVIDRDYRVVVRGSTSNHEFLKTAREGTPMHEYYYNYMDGNPDAFTSSIKEWVHQSRYCENFITFEKNSLTNLTIFD